MDNLNGLLKELKTLVGGTDEANRRRFTEILDELEAHKNEPKVQEALDAFVTSGINEIKQDITALRQQIEEDDYKLIPMSYIAKHYFGKSASWLYQRINGNKVGGRAPVHAQRRTKSHVQPCLTRHSQTHQLVFHCLIRWITHSFL